MATKTYDLTPEELEARRVEIEQQLIQIVREKRRAQWLAGWQITKAVFFPLVVLVGVVGFVVFGALFAVLGESFKKILR
jgi:hypothetical protein